MCLCSFWQKMLCHIGSSLTLTEGLTSGACLRNKENALVAQAKEIFKLMRELQSRKRM